MVADLSRHQRLIFALELLNDDDSSSFEDALWLGFGDEWTGLLQRLLQRRIAHYHVREDYYTMTDVGRDVLRNLRLEAVEIQSSSNDQPGSLSA